MRHTKTLGYTEKTILRGIKLLSEIERNVTDKQTQITFTVSPWRFTVIFIGVFLFMDFHFNKRKYNYYYNFSKYKLTNTWNLAFLKDNMQRIEKNNTIYLKNMAYIGVFTYLLSVKVEYSGMS